MDPKIPNIFPNIFSDVNVNDVLSKFSADAIFNIIFSSSTVFGIIIILAAFFAAAIIYRQINK